MKTRTFKWNRITTVFVFVVAVAISQFSGVELAHATTTDTWTGTAGDGKFSTASNWSGDAAPSNGDVLAFNTASLTTEATLNNDISNLSVGGITQSGANSSHVAGFDITGNALTVTDNITVTSTYSTDGAIVPLQFDANVVLGASITGTGLIQFNGLLNTQTYNLALNDTSDFCRSISQLSGSGTLTLNSTGNLTLSGASSGFSGAVDVTAGYLIVTNTDAFGTGSGANISGTGVLSLYATSDSTWAMPVTLGGSGDITAQHSTTSGCDGNSDSSVFTATLTGPVTLQTDFQYAGSDNLAVTGTYADNGHAFTVQNGSSGTLTLPSGTTGAPVVTNTYSDDQSSTALSVGTNETAILDGARGAVTVAGGGTLEGNGTANSIDISDGTIAPGHSPGTLTSVTTLTLDSDSTYQAQLKDSTAGDYDQIIVGSPSDTGTDVTINSGVNGGATLDTELYPGYSINQGDQFTIIDNQGQAAVNGTFFGLPEGAQFTVGNVTFSISYVGGDGNDVVLTALNTGSDPNAPNTGFTQMLTANPAIIVGLGIVAAGFFTVLAVRRRAHNR